MALRAAPVELPGIQRSPGHPFGVYVHVPFCITRCGYCDFNTYTPAELGGVNPDAWLLALRSELALAAARLDADRHCLRLRFCSIAGILWSADRHYALGHGR